MAGLIATARPRALRARSLSVRLFLLVIRRAATAIRDAAERSSQRRILREWAECHEQHLLRDIGITRDQALREAAKWFCER
jgi:uncharacterized protein YjiS (DUF1127 family)